MLLAYVLSFVNIGIYWNNHHHMLAAVTRVSGIALWANQHLLFWLSLIAAATAWMSQNHFPPIPGAASGAVLLATIANTACGPNSGEPACPAASTTRLPPDTLQSRCAGTLSTCQSPTGATGT